MTLPVTTIMLVAVPKGCSEMISRPPNTGLVTCMQVPPHWHHITSHHYRRHGQVVTAHLRLLPYLTSPQIPTSSRLLQFPATISLHHPASTTFSPRQSLISAWTSWAPSALLLNSWSLEASLPTPQHPTLVLVVTPQHSHPQRPTVYNTQRLVQPRLIHYRRLSSSYWFPSFSQAHPGPQHRDSIRTPVGTRYLHHCMPWLRMAIPIRHRETSPQQARPGLPRSRCRQLLH